MKKTKIVIVGGVAGGATALARLRRLDEDAEIVLFERGSYVSFANCGLPYYVGGEITDRDELFVATRESIEEKYRVDIRIREEVVAIDRAGQTVEVVRLDDGHTYRESYDKLLLATGGSPIVPPLPGIDEPNVFTVWTVPDVDRILTWLEEKKPQSAVVVGGGFIGLEMAENLVERGLRVDLVEMAPQVMAPLDPDMAQLIENKLRDHGIQVHVGAMCAAIEDQGKTVCLGSGARLATDLVILSIGTRANSELAVQAGLEVNARRGIVVDDWLRTSDPHIYAIGDVIEVRDFVGGGRTMVPLAGPANKQGRIVAANLLGRKRERYDGTQGTSILRVFDIVAASTGQNEKTLQSVGLLYGRDYHVALIHAGSHAGYFPGAEEMTLKLIFAADGRVLGAQIVGGEGVDKRIDVIATALRFGASIYDLQKLELAYAPPFSSAKDPVNMVGFVAENLLQGISDSLRVKDLESLPEGTLLLDIREKEEYRAGELPGSRQIPLSELRERLDELPRDQLIVVYCVVGLRGYLAERILKQKGFRVKNLQGGYRSYWDQVECPVSGVRKSAEWRTTESGETVPLDLDASR